MTVIPFQPEHLAQLTLQPAQLGFESMIGDPRYGPWLAEAGPGYTVLAGDELVACAGFWPQWEGRAIVWALVSETAGKHFLGFHRAVLRAFDAHPYRRIETTVKTGFTEGERWARMLGMTKEATLRSYAPNGDDYDLYSKVTA
jgi:hypothetical protein